MMSAEVSRNQDLRVERTLLSGCLDTEVAFLQKTPILELLLPILAWTMCHATGEKQISGIVGTARHTIVREEKRRG